MGQELAERPCTGARGVLECVPRLRACAALRLVPCQIAVQQKEGRQALLAVQRVQRRYLLAAVLLVHYVAKDEVEVKALAIAVQRGTQVGNKAFAHLACLLVLAALGVVALEQWDLDGLHLRAIDGPGKQLCQTGKGAVALCWRCGHGGIGHCRYAASFFLISRR